MTQTTPPTARSVIHTALIGILLGAGGILIMAIGSAIIGTVILGLLWILNELVIHGPQLGAQL